MQLKDMLRRPGAGQALTEVVFKGDTLRLVVLGVEQGAQRVCRVVSLQPHPVDTRRQDLHAVRPEGGSRASVTEGVFDYGPRIIWTIILHTRRSY